MSTLHPDKVLAIIPARGGSKGVPRKNLKLLAGVPLVVHAINAALGAKMVGRVVVSTEDDEIAAVARAAGAEVLVRPHSLATDEARIMPLLNHVLDEMETRKPPIEAVTMIEPTSPFRKPRHIDACVEKLFSGDTQSALTVTQVERNPYNIFKVTGDRAERFIEAPRGKFTARQEFTHLKRVNGCVYATYAENIRRGELIVDPVKIVEMKSEESANIDTPLDFMLAKLCVGVLDEDFFD
jgi:CMP-N,N'-diacetyllegionaminic acid synthase